MTEDMQGSMAEATRLTREGRLTEATALIQRTLGGGFAPTMPAQTPNNVFDVPSRVLRETVRPHEQKTPETEADAPGANNLRRPPAPPRPHRSAPRRAEAPETGTAYPAGGGSFRERSYANGAGSRAYKLYVPGGYAGQETALVVMLHGCTQNADDFAVGTGMNALAEEKGFLVVYPEQDRGSNMNGCWNWFREGDQVRGTGEPSIIAGIACEVIGEYNVDPKRVYVAGMSAGGAMAAVVADAYPDLFAAVGVHSGIAPGAARDLPSAFSAMQGNGATRPGKSAVPAIVFHGDRDGTVSPRNADRLAAHYGTGNAGPRVEKGWAPGGRAYTRAVHGDPEGRATLERWTVQGMGHAWSGGNGRGSYTDPTGPGASARMFEFFERNRAV